MDINKEIERLLQYGIKKGLITPLDLIQKRNELMELLYIDEPYQGEDFIETLDSPTVVLENILDYCFEKGLIPENTVIYRDLMDSKIMGILLDRSSNITCQFNNLREKSPKYATDYFYDLSIASNYIRKNRINKNIEWKSKTEMGDIKITINMSKPELDTKAIEKMKQAAKSSYPKCLLCVDNVGYSGRVNHPPRHNHRVIPIILGNETWYFQYSPYVYYKEHCILLSEVHRPMSVDAKTFERLFDFVNQFPHYFIGANAGMPITGGSILSHDHYQGGCEVFPIEAAIDEVKLIHNGYKEVDMSIIKWPMGTLRLKSFDRKKLSDLCAEILSVWQSYRDEKANIIPFSSQGNEDIPHNGITPIVRKIHSGEYVIHFVFRNNRTSEEYPDGIFHPHKEWHHIKKECIGVIEVMGQAILPGRLNDTIEKIKKILSSNQLYYEQNWEVITQELSIHMSWIDELIDQHGLNHSIDEAEGIIKKEVANIYLRILSDAGVFKYSKEGLAAFIRFLNVIGINPAN